MVTFYHYAENTPESAIFCVAGGSCSKAAAPSPQRRGSGGAPREKRPPAPLRGAPAAGGRWRPGPPGCPSPLRGAPGRGSPAARPARARLRRDGRARAKRALLLEVSDERWGVLTSAPTNQSCRIQNLSAGQTVRADGRTSRTEHAQYNFGERVFSAEGHKGFFVVGSSTELPQDYMITP